MIHRRSLELSPRGDGGQQTVTQAEVSISDSIDIARSILNRIVR
jgi:hypothetical protein